MIPDSPKSFPRDRVLVPEWLDDLPPGDPGAIAARKDLRRVNFLMGNERWILRQIRSDPDAARHGIVEIGSGEGCLLRGLAEHGPATGCDLAARPSDLPATIGWMQGDCLETLRERSGGVLVASLFLHHLDDGSLARLGEVAGRFERLLWVEPLRARLPLALANLMLPFVGPVTRHDMPVSIRAGFRPGELPALCQLGREWRIVERTNFRGAIRLDARRSK